MGGDGERKARSLEGIRGQMIAASRRAELEARCVEEVRQVLEG